MQPTDLSAKLKSSQPGQTPEETNSATGTAGLYRHPISGAEMHTLSDPLYGNAQSEAAMRVGFVRVRDTQPEEIVQINLVDAVEAARRGSNATASDDMKGLMARMNALEAENAALKQGTMPDGATRVLGGEQAKVDGANAVNAQARTTDVAPLQNAHPMNGLDGEKSTTPGIADPTAASVTGGQQPAPTMPVGGPATGQPLPTVPSTDGLTDAGSVQAQAAAAQAAKAGDSTGDLPLTEQSTDELKALASSEGIDVTNLNTNEDLISAIEAKREESEK